MTLKQKKAINNLREAWKHYKQCKSEKGSGETGVSGAVLISDLTLISHPDTVRLDWLAKNDCSLTERLCDEDKDLLDTPFAVIQIQENHCEVLAAASNIHDAIDAAMKQERGK